MRQPVSEPKTTLSSGNPSFFFQWRAEQKKLRRRYIWLVPLSFLSFEILWALWQLTTSDSDELLHGYTMLLYNLPMIHVILLPVMIAVLASRLCDMEIKGDTLKLLYTMQKRTSLYDCKYLTGLKYILLFVLGHTVTIVLLGRMFHFGDTLPLSELLASTSVVFAVSAALLCIQQMLSLGSNNQILPLVVGLAGSFLGLFSMFFPPAAARFVLWGYYAAFPTAGMDWNPATRYVQYYRVPFPLPSFLLFIVFWIVLAFICRTVITRKEV